MPGVKFLIFYKDWILHYITRDIKYLRYSRHCKYASTSVDYKVTVWIGIRDA